MYIVSLLVGLITYLSVDFIRGARTPPERGLFLLSYWMRRLLISHGIVFLIAFWGLRTIDESNWAKDIAAGKAYRLPKLAILANDTASHTTQAVFPTDLDVLLVPHYSSDYLGAYGRVIDLAHPGNVKWNKLASSHAAGYMVLSNQLQEHFCKSLLAYMQQDARFLRQGDRREWLHITDSNELLDVCHQDLVASSNKRIAAMMRQLRSLKTATNHSRFWNTALHRDIIPQYLKRWESLLVPQRSQVPRLMTKSTNSLALLNRKLPMIISRAKTSYRVRSTMPKARKPLEPFPLAWIREGDDVEAMIGCDASGKCTSQTTENYQQCMIHSLTHGIDSLLLWQSHRD